MSITCYVDNLNHAFHVVSIISSNYHMIKDMTDTGFLRFKEKKEADQKQGVHANFNEVVTLHLPFVGTSLFSSSPHVHYEIIVLTFLALSLLE